MLEDTTLKNLDPDDGRGDRGSPSLVSPSANHNAHCVVIRHEVGHPLCSLVEFDLLSIEQPSIGHLTQPSLPTDVSATGNKLVDLDSTPESINRLTRKYSLADPVLVEPTLVCPRGSLDGDQQGGDLEAFRKSMLPLGLDNLALESFPTMESSMSEEVEFDEAEPMSVTLLPSPTPDASFLEGLKNLDGPPPDPLERTADRSSRTVRFGTGEVMEPVVFPSASDSMPLDVSTSLRSEPGQGIALPDSISALEVDSAISPLKTREGHDFPKSSSAKVVLNTEVGYQWKPVRRIINRTANPSKHTRSSKNLATLNSEVAVRTPSSPVPGEDPVGSLDSVHLDGHTVDNNSYHRKWRPAEEHPSSQNVVPVNSIGQRMAERCRMSLKIGRHSALCNSTAILNITVRLVVRIE
ncbi:hypothetical protein Nepgr_014798 [Nepenthes gracilis]|uniref:Uncharacterized protein n=1 Tax=Nepenthes gracilis TaxID=150966 RepID=A0AAD3XPU2_NEPGR|nr:hypothetical protein Nepgr_014798 [Nepenthes gracilis]